jgi:hypothetical protein
MALETEPLVAAMGLALADTETRALAALAELEERGEDRRLAGIQELWNRIAADLNDLESRTADALQTRMAEFLERMAAEIAALPAPEPGEPGAPGRDGADRILALPRVVRASDTCEANEIAHHAGGLWQSVRITSGGPGEDPAGWKCLVPGVAAFEVKTDWQARELIFAARMSDGALHECRGRMGACALPPDYLALGYGVLAGDTFRPEGSEIELLALRDGALLGQAEHWQETRLRGYRGQRGLPGEPGPRGPAGPGLIGLDLVRGDAGLVLLPRFADPAIEAEPIAIDFLVNDPGPGRAVFTCFAGGWNAARTYARGEAVRALVGDRERLVLSIRSENNARPDDGAAWLVMI